MQNIFVSLLITVAALWAFASFYQPSIVPEGYDSLEQYLSEMSKQESGSQDEAFGSTKPAGLFTYHLGGAGVSSSATSFSLTSLTLPQNDYAIQDSDLSTTFYMTIEPGSTDRQEFISCTTVGTNTGSSVTISGCTRGLSPITPYTASTTLQFSHSGGAAVIFSDAPGLFNQFPAKDNTEYITGAWGFQGTAPTSTTCATNNELCNKGYIDTIANQGAATSTETNGGIVELATQLEMASSTHTAAAPRALYTAYSTSSPSSVCGVCVLTTDQNGKFAMNMSVFDWSKNITFSGANTFSGVNTFSGGFLATASSTHTATTTFAGDVVFNAPPSGISTTTIFLGSGTWTKPYGAKMVQVYLIGGGGGGGSARRGVDAGLGGGGGGGGAFVVKTFRADALSATEAVVVGTGGPGGAGQGTNDTNGNAGTAGGTSSFGTNLLAAPGGAGGAGGTADTTTGGAGGQGNGDISVAGGDGGANATDGIDTATAPSPRGGGGGSVAGVASGDGGSFVTNYVKAGGANVTNAVGNAGASTDEDLLIGGVGGSGSSGTGNVGGAGGFPGGGGGGSGSTDGGAASGAGGAGAAGMVIVITYF